MSFPYYFQVFNWRIHPHPLFETLAYLVAARIFFLLRKKWRAETLPLDLSLWIFTGCIVGALAGSKALAWLEAPKEYWSKNGEFTGWENGKTIVGGLLGGWAGVEAIKKALGVTTNTGDVFVFPLIVGMGIGRVGCFLTGLADSTHGVACALPWCVNFGDGIPRHPTQLYEIAFLLLYGTCLLFRIRKPYPNGWLFRLFIFAYMLYRFCVEFIRPRETILMNLSAIQLACVLGMALAFMALRKMEWK